MDKYFCIQCKEYHNLNSDIGIKHLSFSLKDKDLSDFLNFSASATAFTYITKNTEQYVRDTEVFRTLANKFNTANMFANADNAKDWLDVRLSVDDLNGVFRRLQGDGAGEVDAIRHINGSLRGLLFKADFIRDASGHIPSNTDTIDVLVRNRFTGAVVEKIQVKSNWTTGNLHKVMDDFVNSPNYSKDIVLAGPKEFIQEAHKMGIGNPTLDLGTVDTNRDSAERLKSLVEKGLASPSFEFSQIATKIGQGALFGAVISIGVSSITTYISYKRGDITFEEAFTTIGKTGAKGAIVGGTLAGAALFFPPGLIGIGIGFAVGITLRKIIDIAFCDGKYKSILDEMNYTHDISKATMNLSEIVNDNYTMQRIFAGNLEGIHERSKIINAVTNKTDELLSNAIKEI